MVCLKIRFILINPFTLKIVKSVCFFLTLHAHLMTPYNVDSLEPTSKGNIIVPLDSSDKNQFAQCCIRWTQRYCHPGTSTTGYFHACGRCRQLILTLFSHFIDRKQVQELKQIKQIALSISASHCQNENHAVLPGFDPRVENVLHLVQEETATQGSGLQPDTLLDVERAF